MHSYLHGALAIRIGGRLLDIFFLYYTDNGNTTTHKYSYRIEYTFNLTMSLLR